MIEPRPRDPLDDSEAVCVGIILLLVAGAAVFLVGLQIVALVG